MSNEVSIIITAEHKEKFIERTINSCLNQNFKNFEKDKSIF
mgnify:CR=1 FL=1